jgi:hypothetical protein
MDNKPLHNNRPKKNNNRGMKNAGFIAILVLIGLIIIASLNQPNTLKNIPITTAVQQSNKGQYSKIEVLNNELRITKKGESKPSLKSFLEPNATLKDEGFDYSRRSSNS